MNSQIDVSVGWMLHDVARLIRKLADRRFVPVGMTRAQWQALANMKRLGPTTQAALADVMEVETATITRLIDRLETAGWVERRPDPADRRVKLVAMTGKAEKIMDQVGIIGEQLRNDMLADLSTEQRAQLERLLSTVKSRLLSLLVTP